jgi:hypothetical protein
MVQEPFHLYQPREIASTQNRLVGDGCYVSATVNNKRYYGVLIDQVALNAASSLYFQDESSGLDLNRRMSVLLDLSKSNIQPSDPPPSEDRKRPAVDDGENESKRIKQESLSSTLSSLDGIARQVQKFRYVAPQETNGDLAARGYRLLLATYADVLAAADDDADRACMIEAACLSGGDFVGGCYYQYEVWMSRCFSRVV